MNELKPEDVMYWLEQYPEEAVCRDALALLRKYQAENAEKGAEIERLKNSITFKVVMPDEKMEEIKAKLLERIPSIRAEAITEFHRKYHEHLDFMNNINKPSPSWNTDDIQRVIVACGAITDQVKNEMKGATDEN